MSLKKKLGSHYYGFDTQYHNKIKAYNRAITLRSHGLKARVVKVDELTWEVYYRE